MPYIKTNWVDGQTKLSAENLNKMEQGIYDASQAVDIFTNSKAGTIKGSTDEGKVSANQDGTGSVNGFAELKEDVEDIQDEYLVSAAIVNNKLVITDQDGETVEFEGGSVTDVQVNGVSVVSNKVANITGLATQANLTAEANTRSAADILLTNNLNAEIARAGNAEDIIDNALTAEVNARTLADTNLSNSITAEAGLRSAADTALQNNINTKADASTTYTKTEVNNLLNNKQNTLTAGDNIAINNNVISADVKVEDVKINGTSIVDDNEVANITYQTSLGSDSDNAATVTAIRSFVNSSIQASVANYVTSNASGDAFTTKAALLAATTFYNAGVVYTPVKNDYAMVIADESHDNKQSRYINTSSSATPNWNFQYTVGNAFTAAQQAAIDSGITSTLVGQISANTTARHTHNNYSTLEGITSDNLVTASQKTAWTNKQDAISDLSDIRTGAGLGASAVQPATLENYSTTTQMNAAISAYHDSSKQNVISDLATIRSGAALGATALQSVPAEYVTETELAAYHDSTKQDVISDLSTIRSGASAGATALQPSALDDYSTTAEMTTAINNHHDSTKQNSLSSAQILATNSGITAGKVSTYDGYAATIAGKQDALTAGSNITISNNVISATDTKYTAGTNVQINGTTISATDTTYSAGIGLSLSSGSFSNIINYEESFTYIINYHLTHCSIVEEVINYIDTGERVSMYIEADSGYTLPENITVDSATKITWDESTGYLVFENPTNHVSVTITAEQEPTGIAMNWSTSSTRGATPKLKVTRGGTEIINHTGRGLSGTDQVEVGDVIYVSGGSDTGGSYVKADGVEVYRTYDYGSYTVQQGVNVLTVWVDGGLA